MINRLYRPVESLLNISVDFTRSIALFTRIFSYLDMESTIKNCANPLKPDFSTTTIRFDKVNFQYLKDVPLLKDISFEVPCS